MVEIADADRLTILLPISTVLRSLEPFSSMRRTRAAFLSPSSARLLIRALLHETKAVSAEEKKPDKNIRIISVTICMGPELSI